MPTYLAPRVYVEEKSSGIKPVQPVSTSTAAFIGVAQKGPIARATPITNATDFTRIFGDAIAVVPGLQEHFLATAVQHFFAQGGSRCYIVRVAHFTNINNASTLTAARAFADFNATQFSGGAVANAYRVQAINEGKWGEAISVEARRSSKFSVRLAEDVAGGAGTAKLNLVPNTDVQTGSALFLAREVIGIVQSIDAATKTITFQSPLTLGGANFAGNINNAVTVFDPELDVLTTTNLGAPVNVVAGVAPTGIILNSVTKADGSPLRIGDALHFALAETKLIVTSIRDAQTAGGKPAMEIGFAAQNMPNLTAATTGVYARDFTLIVNANGATETHANLSLTSTHASDFVNDRLSPESGASLFITARKNVAVLADDLLADPAGPASLGSGNDGLAGLTTVDFTGSDVTLTGLHALDPIDDVSILCVPAPRITTAAEPSPLVNLQNLTAGTIAYVEKRKDLFYIIDPPRAGNDPIGEVRTFRQNFSSQYAGIYFPWIRVNRPGAAQLASVPPSGAVAGVFARTDARRGVHKAPAGIDTGILAVAGGVDHNITPGENDLIYPANVNAIRVLADGITVWGSRTISADPEWQQVNVRRLFIFLEQSIEHGTQWVVFEPNDPALWKAITRNIRAFLRIQWLEGKLVGTKEEEAFFVKCDEETNPPEVVDAGQVITEIGVAPSRPAEFVIFRIRQFAAAKP